MEMVFEFLLLFSFVLGYLTGGVGALQNGSIIFVKKTC